MRSVSSKEKDRLVLDGATVFKECLDQAQEVVFVSRWLACRSMTAVVRPDRWRPTDVT